MNTKIEPKLKKLLITAQKKEINGYHIYRNIAKKIKDQNNKKIVSQIASQELAHYNYLKTLTNKDLKPNYLLVWLYSLMGSFLGITFTVKLMEKSEDSAQDSYEPLVVIFPEIQKVIDEEEEHENELIAMVEEEHLQYMGSVVLGLNDALVELTGAMAGLTLALGNTRLIALTGLITGIAASLSMASSEYLSTKAEAREKGEQEQEGKKIKPLKSAVYTGITYIFTVFFLVIPFLLLNQAIAALAVSLAVAVLIIFIFNFYISVAGDLNFKRRFFEMAGISLGVSLISFFIGILVKEALGVEI